MKHALKLAHHLETFPTQQNREYIVGVLADCLKRHEPAVIEYREKIGDVPAGLAKTLQSILDDYRTIEEIHGKYKEATQ